MMNSANEMIPLAPQMIGCCPFGFLGMSASLISTASPIIAVAVVVYLLTKRPQVNFGPNEV